MSNDETPDSSKETATTTKGHTCPFCHQVLSNKHEIDQHYMGGDPAKLCEGPSTEPTIH